MKDEAMIMVELISSSRLTDITGGVMTMALGVLCSLDGLKEFHNKPELLSNTMEHLKNVASKAKSEQKNILGNLGIVKATLESISDHLQHHIPDDVLEDAWHVISDVTFNTATNRERFVDGQGMVYFRKCLKMFLDKPNLLRKMMRLLKNVANAADDEQKNSLGNQGIIETLLELISEGLQQHLHDSVLRDAWDVMGYMVIDNPTNSQRFLDGQGIMHFQRCYKEFPNELVLLRYMMRTLLYVAAVKESRCRLMTPDLLTTFSDLLQHSDSDVSNKAAGVLSHIASDGIEAWIIDHPTRTEVLGRMDAAIETWDLDTSYSYYRILQPEISLLKVYHTPQCQHWAAWTLANRTRRDPLEYCPMVEKEGGIQLLEDLLKSPLPSPRIKTLAKMVITKCQS